MKTIKEEINAIATIIQGNTSSTILELYNIGFDFNKLIGEQDGDIDEKVSQMLLNSLVTIVPATIQEEQPQPQIEEPKQDQIQVIEQDLIDKMINEVYTQHFDELSEEEKEYVVDRVTNVKDKLYELKNKLSGIEDKDSEDYEREQYEAGITIDKIVYDERLKLRRHGYTDYSHYYNKSTNNIDNAVETVLTSNKIYKMYEIIEEIIYEKKNVQLVVVGGKNATENDKTFG